MDLPTQAIISVLTYLLPGFIAAAIWFNLTPSPRPQPFERVVQALILTILVQALVTAFAWLLIQAGKLYALGTWSENARLIWSVVVAGLLGLLLAYFSNTDSLHALLRKLNITHQTSFPSEWYGAFCNNTQFVVLHLVGERRLYGWAQEWPSSPEKGHFVVVQGQWLRDDTTTAANEIDRIVVPAKDVEMVEFISPREPQ